MLIVLPVYLRNWRDKKLKYVTEILSGIGILIALYLILSNAKGTSNLISSFMDSMTKGIKTLQGR